MNIDDMKLGDLKKIAAMFGGGEKSFDNGMIGKYVIVRCRDAGVHTGYLESHNGRECVLKKSRRLWYWKCASEKSFLSGVAVAGLHSDSKVGAEVEIIHLTENCEIIKCEESARISIQEKPDYDQQ